MSAPEDWLPAALAEHLGWLTAEVIAEHMGWADDALSGDSEPTEGTVLAFPAHLREVEDCP